MVCQVIKGWKLCRSLRYKELPEADLVEEGVLPDIKYLYEFSEAKADNDRKFAGVLLSHSHRDHYGLVDYVHYKYIMYQ